jgi:hypothetical protein
MGSDSYIRRVRDQTGAFHDTHGLAVEGHRQLGELCKYLRHLVTALATPHVNNRVTVRELGLNRT